MTTSTLITIQLTSDEVDIAMNALAHREDDQRLTTEQRLHARAVRLAIKYAADRALRPVDLQHTVRGKTLAEAGVEGWPYGTTHDMDCPACQDTPFTASPRSETYWSS